MRPSLLERIREIMAEQGFTFNQAAQAVWPTNIFTTHTPVPAGNERFSIELIDKYFRSWSQILPWTGRPSWPWAASVPTMIPNPSA
jgi:glucan phosphorylase